MLVVLARLFKSVDRPLKSGLGAGAFTVVVDNGVIVIVFTGDVFRSPVGKLILVTTVLLGESRLLLMILGTLMVVIPRLLGNRLIVLTELLVSPER